MVVKDNHPMLRKKIACFFDSPDLFEAQMYRACETSKRRRGRQETRTLRVSDDVPPGFTGFAGVRQLLCLERRVLCLRTGQERSETVYAMTSLARVWCSAPELLALLRGHWTIENRVHYVRDVTMHEDASQVRTGSLPQVMVALRHFALSLIRQAGHANVAAARRLYAARPHLALQLLGIERDRGTAR